MTTNTSTPPAELREHAASLTKLLLEQFQIELQHMRGQHKVVRYSSEAMGAATAVWSRSKRGYSVLSEYFNLPSISRLQKGKQALRPTSRFDEGIYLRAQAAIRELGITLRGYVIFDELKTDPSGLVFNTQTHKIVGFADPTLSLDDVVLVQGSARSRLVSYVNQFLFKSCTKGHKLSFLCDHYFSAGPTDGVEVSMQLTHVMRCLESIGIQVCGFVSDAGGGNSGSFALMRELKTEPPQSVGWLGKEYTSKVNPYDASRRVYMWYCAAHGE